MFLCVFMLVSMFQVYEFYLLFHSFFTACRCRRVLEVFMYILMYMMQTIPYLCVGIPAVTMMCSFLSIVMVAFIYKASYKKNFLVALFIFVLMLMAEFLTGTFFGYVNMELFLKEEYYSIFATVFLPVVQYVIVMIVKNCRFIQDGEKVSVSYWLVSVLLPIFTVYVFFAIYRQPALSETELVMSTAALLLLNVGIVYLFDRQMEKQRLEMETKYQKNQLAIMDETVKQVRKYKHDLQKHISMLAVFVEEEKKAEALEYLFEMESDITQGQKYAESGNIDLDSILNYKLQEAYVEKILVDLKVNVPKEMRFSVYDMNRLLSNLLDNSIEACKNLEVEKRKIDLEIIYDSCFLMIHIVNHHNPGVKIEKENPEGHGYGTRIVHDIVEKYQGTYDIVSKDGIYDVEVVLFM